MRYVKKDEDIDSDASILKNMYFLSTFYYPRNNKGKTFSFFYVDLKWLIR